MKKIRFYRSTWAEINLKNLAYNFLQIKKHLLAHTKIMVTVKADAYGHGMIPVAKKISSCGADYLGVASIDEGIKLRENKIKKPILILGMILYEDIAPLFKYNLTPTVCTYEFALVLERKARALGKKINVHIKIDTGMGRLGILYKDSLLLVRKIHKLRFLKIEGIFTHLAVADTNKDFTVYQINIFNRLIEKLRQEKIYIPLVHAANSIGIVDFKESHFNMVRPGLVIYGLYPKNDLNIKLKPVLSLITKIVYFKKVPKDYGISYGHSYMTKKNTTIVTLPIGYGDGYPRNLSNKAEVLIAGKRFAISGRICMDQIMVDVGRARVKLGQQVVLIGCQGKEKVSAEELAVLAETIPYEIVCNLGSRIPRIYN